MLVAVVVHVTAGPNLKRAVQTLASAALRMEVSVDGRLHIGFCPGLHVRLENVRIRNRGSDVASAAQASLGIELLPLLHKEVRIDALELRHVRISIERQPNGRLNLATLTKDNEASSPWHIAQVSLSDATLRYRDQQSGKGFDANSCDLGMRHLHLADQESASVLKRLSFTAVLACGNVRTKDQVWFDLKSSIAEKEGVFDFAPITMQLFGGKGSGTIRADFSGSVPEYRIHYSLSKFNVAEFLKAFSPRNVGDGPMDFSANLSMRGTTLDEAIRSAGGEAFLQAKDLTLEVGDLDQQLSRYESSQNLNLVDVGAFFLAGPVGIAVTKGYDFASILRNSGGHSQIRTLVSKWNIERGVAQAKDVAMVTKENRIALTGELDFVNRRFKDVTVALVDARGCARAQQKINGAFGNPEVEKPNVLMSLAGPARNLLRQAQGLIGRKCAVFYAGSVAAPH